MGVARRVRKAFAMQLLSLLPLLCIVSAAPEGGLFGFGLLGGDSATTNTTTTSSAASTTSTTTASPATTTALVEALTTTASSGDHSGIIQNLVDVLTGKVATIALDQLSSLLGLNNPVPSPLSDPIILAAVTLNPPALALAMGGLAGNLVLTHIFTIATEALVTNTVAAA